jgi:hypothetical protein
MQDQWRSKVEFLEYKKKRAQEDSNSQSTDSVRVLRSRTAIVADDEDTKADEQTKHEDTLLADRDLGDAITDAVAFTAELERKALVRDSKHSQEPDAAEQLQASVAKPLPAAGDGGT